MDLKSQKRLETGWKTITLIGVIMGAGFAGATYLGKYKVAEDAKLEHKELREATSKVNIRTDDLQDEVKTIQLVNVRIEVSQQQIQDQLKLISLQGQSRMTRADRVQVRTLEEKTRKRGEALEKSYKIMPIVKNAGSKMNDDNPLAGIEGL